MKTLEEPNILDEIVKNNIVEENNKFLIFNSNDILPLEMEAFESGQVIKNFANIDKSIHAQYPVFDIDTVLSMKHPSQNINGKNLPRFALYNVLKKNENIQTFRVSDRFRLGKKIIICLAICATLAILMYYINPGPTSLGIPYHTLKAVGFSICIMMGVYFIIGTIGVIITYFEDKPVEYTISSKFIGIIPKGTRNNIKNHMESKVWDDICVLQEVEKWHIKKPVINLNRKLDPLVLGKKNEVWYLIDRFDTTTMEEYISKEFTM